MRRAALFLLLVCSAGARAAPNDLQLWRLGSPDNFTVCTVCNGTDNTLVPGDPSAQTRFARLTATLALASVAVSRAKRVCAEGSPGTSVLSVPLHTVQTVKLSGLPSRQSCKSFGAARAPAEQTSKRKSAARRILGA